MLVEFRVANFRSFRNEQTLSLVASNDDSLPENCIDTERFKLLRTAAVYGPNASGKSNLIKAMGFMRDTVVGSAQPNPSTTFPLSSFVLDAHSSSRPSVFEVTIILDGARYQYGFAISPDRVQEEWLFVSPMNKARMWFQRGLDEATGESTWHWGPSFRGEKHRLANLTRPDSRFLSVAAQWNHQPLAPVQKWFDESLRTLPASATMSPITVRALITPEVDSDHREGFKTIVVSLLKQADLGIADVNVQYPQPERTEIPDSNYAGFESSAVTVLHHNQATGRDVPFDLVEESDGTQRLFELIGPRDEALRFGYVVSVDEIEESLHPLLTRELIRLFQSPRNNRNNAQLVFATHDTTLLDPELLRRDQIWFTEKDQIGATTLRPLSDYRKARKGEAMQKGYLAGRYGAIPVLKAFGVQ